LETRRAISFLVRAALCALVLFPVAALCAPGSLVPSAERISDAEARLELARLLSASGSGRAEALELLQSQLRQSPEDVATRLALAELFARSGRLAEAEEALRALTAKALAQPETQERIGDAYFSAGRMPEAARHFQSALAGGRPVLRKLAQALAWSGDTNQARPMLEKLLAENPADREVALLVVRLRLAAGDASGAAALARQLAQAAPNNPEALAELADVEAALGHAARARELYEKALALPEGTGLLPRYAQAMQLWGPSDAPLPSSASRSPRAKPRRACPWPWRTSPPSAGPRPKACCADFCARASPRKRGLPWRGSSWSRRSRTQPLRRSRRSCR